MQTRSAISCSQASTGFRQDANIKRCLNAEFTFYAIEAFRVGLTSKSQGAARRGVARLVGIEGGVVSGVINLESSGVQASDWRPRHDEHYHEA